MKPTAEINKTNFGINGLRSNQSAPIIAKALNKPRPALHFEMPQFWFRNGVPFVAALNLFLGATMLASAAPIKNIVLVHGAFVDGSGWHSACTTGACQRGATKNEPLKTVNPIK